jgi:hypothetical protein
MARPLKKNAEYFSHDNDMRNDEKLKAVRRKFKHEGYSIWNMILEKLCKSDGFTLDYNDKNVELWAGDFEIEPELLKDMILYFIHVDLLLFHDGLIFSETMIERFNPLMEKRKSKRQSIEPSKPEDTVVSDVHNSHTILNNSIVYNILNSGDLMENFSIDQCKLPEEDPSRIVIETAIKLYRGFKAAFPNNKDLVEKKKKEWIPPVRDLIQKDKYEPKQIFELTQWAITEGNSWRPYIMDAASLEKNFEKIKEKYLHEAAKQT